jgi:hypothetical protein
MKITKLTLGLPVLAIAGLFLGCKKPEPNVAPVADTETQTAVDAAWATYVVTDIDMMCSFLGENDCIRHFYTDVPGTSTSTEGWYDYTRDISEQRLSMNWFNTKCLDGRVRSGEVRLVYNPTYSINPRSNPNANYYHDYGFGGRLTLTDYRVDGWLITMPEPGYIYNEQLTNPWDGKTLLKWHISAKFHFQHPTDSTGKSDITWDGKIWKVLDNTLDKKVFTPTREPAITWSISTCSYYGDILGTTNGGVIPGSTGIPYTMKITEKNSLKRDFTCTPDRVAGVTIDDKDKLDQRDDQHHPFVKGIAEFKTADKYPRQVYFGNESNTTLAWQCDNTGEVMIKGIAYRVNFKK